jgi:hypothetical protein
MRLTSWWPACACLLMLSCTDLEIFPSDPPPVGDQITITQGIWGSVRLWEGDFMPGIHKISGTVTPVERDVWIFEATRFDSVVAREGGFYTRILTQLKAKTRSNAMGFYQASLPPGKYSIFVAENNLYYANGTDEAGHLVPGVVTAGAVTRVQIDITYRAAF